LLSFVDFVQDEDLWSEQSKQSKQSKRSLEMFRSRSKPLRYRVEELPSLIKIEELGEEKKKKKKKKKEAPVENVQNLFSSSEDEFYGGGGDDDAVVSPPPPDDKKGSKRKKGKPPQRRAKRPRKSLLKTMGATAPATYISEHDGNPAPSSCSPSSSTNTPMGVVASSWNSMPTGKKPLHSRHTWMSLRSVLSHES
jgi:hypothetical protein